MYPYSMSEDEKKYLSEYDITRYDRPSVAADIVIFSIMTRRGLVGREQVQDKENYRKMPEKKLKILLIRRADYPYKNCWALPGGFCRKGEDVCEAARRELYEETHVENAYLSLCGVYGAAGRDPRGWIISNTFLALMDGEKCSLKAGSDAWEARWFDVVFDREELARKVDGHTAFMENRYSLTLTDSDIPAANLPGDVRETPPTLSAVVHERKEFKAYHETVQYEVVENDGLAFDHAKIIAGALLFLRRQAEADGKIVFDLMPPEFAWADLQSAFEIILNKKLLTANFRRKMADYVTETGRVISGAGHRPARLLRRNVDAFY